MSMDPSALSGLERSFSGRLITRSNPDYDSARIVWNGIIDRHPALIARCENEDDIATAVRFAREQELVIAVRCGGHSVGGFSTCDDGIVIDLSGMRGVTVDPDRRIARVRGGSLLGDLDREAQGFGLACPVGVVSHTGVAGLTLGGGMGRLQRKFGFTVDNLRAVEMVGADGERFRAGLDENEELFWGIRGAGANFGIATTFEYALHPVGPDVTLGTAAYRGEDAQEVLERFVLAVGSAPDEVMPTLLISLGEAEDPWPSHVGEPIIFVRITHCGDPSVAEEEMADFLAGDSLMREIVRTPYLEIQTANDSSLDWGNRFYMKGGFVEELTPEILDVAIEAMRTPPGDCSIGFWTQGGAIARVPEDAMAFTGRTAGFWVGAEAFWTSPEKDEAMMSWGRRTWDDMAPHTAGGHYVNDMVETSKDIVKSIYGPWKYERLVDLKRKHDPDNVFRLNQNIAP